MQYKKRSGFTLIELLVVVAIIGILATLATVSLNSARAKARDAKKVHDVSQLRTALEMYKNDAGVYPEIITIGMPISFGHSTYLNSVPAAPKGGDCTEEYGYTKNPDGTYLLNLCLENGLNDELPAGSIVANESGFIVDKCTIEWSSNNLTYNNWWNEVAYGGGKYVLVGELNAGVGTVFSNDGVNYNNIPVSPPDTSIKSVAYGVGKFVAVGSSGVGGEGIFYSSDAMSWTRPLVTDANSWVSVIYNAGKFVALGDKGQIKTSINGSSWTDLISGQEAYNFSDLVYGNGRYVAIADGNVKVSTDGQSWVTYPLPVTDSWFSLTYGNGKFIAVSHGNTGNILSSTNGIDWTVGNSEYVKFRNSVAYGNGKFVAVSFDNPPAVSSDGLTWKVLDTSMSSGALGVNYVNNRFMIFSQNSVVKSICN